MTINVRPQFYLDVAEEVAYLAEHASTYEARNHIV